MNTEIRELTIDELDEVTGAGTVEGYQFCPNGPAGSGLYPEYVDCEGGGAVKQLIGAFKKGIQEGLKGGGRPK